MRMSRSLLRLGALGACGLAVLAIFGRQDSVFTIAILAVFIFVVAYLRGIAARKNWKLPNYFCRWIEGSTIRQEILIHAQFAWTRILYCWWRIKTEFRYRPWLGNSVSLIVGAMVICLILYFFHGNGEVRIGLTIKNHRVKILQAEEW